jgi:hypothetical protein
MSAAEDAIWNDFIRSDAKSQVVTTRVEASELVDYTKADKVVFFAGSKSLEFTVEGIPDWIQRMKKGESWFTPSPGLDAIRHAHSLLAISLVADKELLYTMGSGLVLGASGIFATPILGFESFFALGGLIGAAAGAGLGNLTSRWTKFKKKKQNFRASLPAYDEINYAGLHAWLLARYNVKVDRRVVHSLYEGIHQNKSSVKFADVDRREWIFSRHTSGEGWFVEPVVPAAVREASYVEVATMVTEKEAELPVEAAKLWESLQTSIAKLSGESEAEAEHASLRILEDARSAVQDYRKLVKLGGEVQGESILVRVLTLLNTETSGLLEELIERVVSNMEVQSEYLHTRQQHAGLHRDKHVQLSATPEVEHLMETRKQ